MVEKNNSSKKLRILTQGEDYLPIIKRSYKISFPIRSYFVLAQLYEDYIQLTLNQVVTEPSLEEEQEAIIIDDRIIPIQNIYAFVVFVYVE